jgi:2-haloacid dehalogenase
LTGHRADDDGRLLRDLRAIVFDTFGTLVDWRTSIIRQLEAFGREHGIEADWAALTDAWRSAYRLNMQKVRSGELPWRKLDELHRMELEALLEQFGVDSLTEHQKRHLNRTWHRLDPWPDSVPAMRRLKSRFILSPLSNGNVALLTNLARHAALPFDLILCAEICRHYKPDPETYRMAYQLLDLEPYQVMLIAAHNDDLVAACREGLRTGFVARPTEYGPGQQKDRRAEHRFDIVGTDLMEIADRLLGEPA